MESNIKGLVAAGHEMASELKAECGAVDMRSVAKLISDLATQLEVQLVRANALAAENAVMLETIEAVRSVADNSSGISGWHLNGDIATWEEILPEINDIEPQPPMLFWLKLNAKQSTSSLTALNTSCVTSCLRMTPKRCLRLCVFFWKNRKVSKNDDHKTTCRRNHIPY